MYLPLWGQIPAPSVHNCRRGTQVGMILVQQLQPSAYLLHVKKRTFYFSIWNFGNFVHNAKHTSCAFLEDVLLRKAKDMLFIF